MNRTLRRPMFRMGGSAEGITSGLSMPRQGYKDAKLVEVPEEKDAPISQELIDLGIFRTGGPKKNLINTLAPRQERKDTSFNDFLINFGLDLMSRPKQGKGFSGDRKSVV